MKDLCAKIHLLGLIYLCVNFFPCDAFQSSSRIAAKSVANGGMITTERALKVNEYQQASQRTFQLPLRMSSKDTNDDEVGKIQIHFVLVRYKNCCGMQGLFMNG